MLCGNFVTIVDGRMVDATAGHLSSPESAALIAQFNEVVAGQRCRFYRGAGYRFYLVVNDADDLSPACLPPHQLPDQPVANHRLRGRGSDYLVKLVARCSDLLRDHDVNLVRRDLGENPATDIWLWGPGRLRTLEPFADRHHQAGTLLPGRQVLQGLGAALGMTVLPVPKRHPTDTAPELPIARAAVEALADHDLVVVQVGSAEPAARAGDADGKVAALERIDRQVIGPLLERLEAGGPWRLMVAIDHATSTERRIATADPTPFCFTGKAVHAVLKQPFCEANAAASDLQIDRAHELMEYFLRG